MIRSSRAAAAGASFGESTMVGSPWPARASASMSARFTELPMPNAKQLASERRSRTSRKAWASTPT